MSADGMHAPVYAMSKPTWSTPIKTTCKCYACRLRCRSKCCSRYYLLQSVLRLLTVLPRFVADLENIGMLNACREHVLTAFKGARLFATKVLGRPFLSRGAIANRKRQTCSAARISNNALCGVEMTAYGCKSRKSMRIARS